MADTVSIIKLLYRKKTLPNEGDSFSIGTKEYPGDGMCGREQYKCFVHPFDQNLLWFELRISYRTKRYLISDAVLLRSINISELPFGPGMVINSENFPEKSPSPHVNYPERALDLNMVHTQMIWQGADRNAWIEVCRIRQNCLFF